MPCPACGTPGVSRSEDCPACKGHRGIRYKFVCSCGKVWHSNAADQKCDACGKKVIGHPDR